jgi:hypothetical protein
MLEEEIAAAKAEVQWLLDAGFIREVEYPTRLANVVMIKKKNRKWWMCIDFTGLNKCCPKDDFPLSRINKVVDSATGCEMMALLDCFSIYHQIWLCKEDEEKNKSHHTLQHVLLHMNAQRPEKYWLKFMQNGKVHTQRPNQHKCFHLCRWHSGR